MFGDIALTEDLIGCNKSFVIQSVVDEVMINLDVREFAICMNIVEGLAVWEESFEFY